MARISPSPAATTGLAPRARSTLRSSSPRRSWREIACIPSTKATRPAMAPNAPRATDSGLTASSTWAATTEVAWISYPAPSGRGRADNPTDEGGCRHHEAVRPVDVVLDHLVVEHDDPDQPRPHAEARH